MPPFFPRFDHCVHVNGHMATAEVWDMLSDEIADHITVSISRDRTTWPEHQTYGWSLQTVRRWAEGESSYRNRVALRRWQRDHG